MGGVGSVQVLSCACLTSGPPTGWNPHRLLGEAFHHWREAQRGSQVQADFFLAEPWERAWSGLGWHTRRKAMLLSPELRSATAASRSGRGICQGDFKYVGMCEVL